jgi:hypothetical protein
MGLKLRYNLFHDTTAAAVYGAFVSFYQKRGRPLQLSHDDSDGYRFYREHNGWVVVDWDAGWEWKERREAQLLVSQRLCCPGFLIFVYDGDYWGYEFFDRGKVFDHFVQESESQPIWFPGEDCRGNAGVLAEHLPSIRIEDIEPYLMQMHDWVMPKDMNVPARPGDEFRRFDECAVLDFLRMLGVPVQLRDGYVRVESSVYR